MFNFIKNVLGDSSASSATPARSVKQQQPSRPSSAAASPPPAPVGQTTIAPELVEMTREWSSIQRFFDAAISIAGGSDEGALCAQLSDLDAKLRHMVALVYCGGSLPASVPAGTSWTELPVRLVNAARQQNGGAVAVLRCLHEAYGIFALVCQHAKLNMPRGSRSVLAAFMVDLIRMCETITTASLIASTAASTSKSGGGGRSAATSVAPASDVGHVLVEQRAALGEPLINFLSKTVHDVIAARRDRGDSSESRLEKLHFARLLRILCEAVAYQGGRLLESTRDMPAEPQQSGSKHDVGAMMAETGRLTLPWLLDVVTLFSHADDLYPVSTQALDTVLRAHLTLAVSPVELPEAKAAAHVDTLISQLGLTFVTLCRFEDNADFDEQRELCLITVRYFDSLCAFAPHAADAAGLYPRFYRFLLSTVAVMVALPSDRTFVVAALVLSQMMEACVPGASHIPALIAQAILLPPPPPAATATATAAARDNASDALFARLTDISGSVRSAATHFLLACIRCCPRLFAALLARSKEAAAASGTGLEEPDSESAAQQQQGADSICDALFPAISRSAGLCVAPAAAQRALEGARARLLLGEALRGVAGDEDGALPSPRNFPHFEARRAAFEKQLRRALIHDMQQFTTHETMHCALLTGIFVEMLSIPSARGASSDRFFEFLLAAPTQMGDGKRKRGGLLFDVLPSLAQHIDTRLQRIAAAATQGDQAAESNKSAIERIVAEAPTVEDALDKIQKQVSDELRPFARGIVHLAAIYSELKATLLAREEKARLDALRLD